MSGRVAKKLRRIAISMVVNKLGSDDPNAQYAANRTYKELKKAYSKKQIRFT